jgi:hypothetical protein
MRRILLMAVASSALALAAPGVASAHHSKHHSSRHKRHTHAHLVKFGTFGTAFGPASPSGSTPTSPSGETAGTVASFTGGVLTITLKDGSTVSGKVTEQTGLECQSATPSTSTEADDEGGGDDSSGGASGEHGGPVEGHPTAHESSDSGGGDAGGDEGGSSSCTTAALVPGAVVGEAELSVSGAGAVWDKVQLIQ